MDEDDYNGWLEAFKTVEVRSRVRGHITKVHFNDGDIVKEGQPLFDLDPAPFEAELKQAEAQAKALEAQKVAADKDVERNRNLLKSNAVSQQELEKSEADAESYDAQIAAKKAEADRRRLDLKYAKITADLAGKISKANLTEGNLVNAGGSDPLLTTIVAIDPIYVDFNVDERAMQRYQEIGAGRQGKDEQQPLREQKIPFSFGLDTEKGFPHRGPSRFRGQQVHRGHRHDPGPRRRQEPRRPAHPRLPRPRAGPGERQVRGGRGSRHGGAHRPGPEVPARRRQRTTSCSAATFTPGRLLDDGMRVILPAPGEEKAAGNEDWIKNWEKEWVITVGLQRARIDYPVQPLGRQRPTDRQPTACRRSNATSQNQPGTRSCLPVSSSTGRSSPRCSRW